MLRVIKQALQGGVTIVQFRDKTSSTASMVHVGRVLHALTKLYGVPLIVNDSIDVALAIDAEGVHLGQDDIQCSIARELLGKKKIVGVSVKTVAQAKQAIAQEADYLGVGALFATHSKSDAGRPIGLTRLTKIVKVASIPVVGIGGITTDNAAAVVRAGADGIAVISAISKAKNPKEAAMKLLNTVKIYAK